jgi:hypothetical protein
LTSIDYPFAVKVGGIEMLGRVILGCMMMLVCLPVPNQAWPQQESLSPIRILVEGDGYGSASRFIIEALRRATAKTDIKLGFASGSADPYHIRLLIDGRWDSREVWDYSEEEGSTTRTETFYATSANAQKADGKLLFEVQRNGSEPRSAYEKLVTEVIKNIHRHVESLRKESILSDRVSQESIDQIEPKDAVNAMSEDKPKEPGVYYKNGTAWILLAESLTKHDTRGIATAILTIGLSSVRSFDVYLGVSANAQFREQKPEFYVRDFQFSEGKLAIIKLKKVKDRREVQRGAFSFRGSSRLSDKDIHRIKVTQISDDFYKLVPETELESGEYVLDLDLSDSVNGAYEFGVK